MILIGERINGMFINVKEAIADRNKKVIQELAQKQTEAGATYLDVNVGTAASDQESAIQWLVETIQETCSTPLSLDSQKPAVREGGQVHRLRRLRCGRRRSRDPTRRPRAPRRRGDTRAAARVRTAP